MPFGRCGVAGAAYTLDFFSLVPPFGLFASFQLLRRGMLRRCEECGHHFRRSQEGRWKRVVFVRAGLQGRTWIVAVSCRWPPPAAGEVLGRAPQELFPDG